jgi:outer membrane lipoprotein-sorting protein
MILQTALLYPITGDEAVQKFRQRMAGIGKFSGVISLSTSSGQTYTGNLTYMAPGRIYIKFTSPFNKVLAANTKKLWVYDPHAKVCAVQDLDVETPMSGGIISVINDYAAVALPSGSDSWTVKFKNDAKPYPEITLNLDPTFFIKGGSFQDAERKGFAFSLSNINFSPSILKNYFDFEVPSGTQMIKNPLNIK